MFMHNLKYSLKTLFRKRMLIFWTFAFPVILATLFNLAFSDIEKNEKLDIIDIAIIEDEKVTTNKIFKEAFNNLSDEKNEDRLFNTKYVDENEAKRLLENNEITGYLLVADEPKITITSSGINETIFKFVTEEISQTAQVVEKIAASEIQKQVESRNYNIDYEKIYKEALEIAQENRTNIKDISKNNLSYTMIEFYTLIAMACLYGGMLGMTALNQVLANMDSTGRRVAVSPVSKGKLILSSAIASYITQLIGIAILFAYTVFILKIDYGNNLPLIVSLTLAGCLAGLAIGIAVTALLKANEGVKIGIIISYTMLGSFFSGMMGITMKYIIDKNIPIINKLNPANMITDGFYSLYYYDTYDRFYFNLISLLIFAFVMIGISIFRLRRQKYDSI